MTKRLVGIFLCGLVCAAVGAPPARAAISNGDFATGDFTGWITSAGDDFGDPLDPANFLSVVPLGSGNAARLDTGEFATDALFIATVEQTFLIDPAAAMLTFDFTLPTQSVDPTGPGTGAFLDTLFVSVDDGVDLFELLLVDNIGPLEDPFATAPGPVSVGPPSDAAFDFRMSADLSSLAGSNVTLFVDLVQEDDSQVSVFHASNFALVPEPSSWLLAVLGLAALTVFVHRRRAE